MFHLKILILDFNNLCHSVVKKISNPVLYISVLINSYYCKLNTEESLILPYLFIFMFIEVK